MTVGPAGTSGLLPHRCLKVPFSLQASGGGVGMDRGKVDGDNGVTGGISPSQASLETVRHEISRLDS